MAAGGGQSRAGRASAGIAHALAVLALLLPQPLLAQSYPNPLNNTATVTAPSDVADPVPGNNTAIDTNALALQAQLSVSKTLLSTSPVLAGGPVQYRIEVSNAGPSAATSVGVVDTVSTLLGAVSWTCAGATAASSCAQASGTGNAINVLVNVAVGDSVVLLVNATAPTATPATVPANNVSLVLPAGTTDPTPGNNSASAPAVPVQPNALVAVNDSFATAVSSSSGGSTPSVLGNDTLNGAPVNGADLIISLLNAPPGFTINSAGVVSVPAGAPAGARAIDYRICESASPANCASATANMVIAPTAVNDSFNVTGGTASFTGDLGSNDNAPTGAVYSLSGAAVAGLAVNTTGTFTYAPVGGIATPVTFSYQACLPAPDGSVCSTATAAIVVNANALQASNDAFVAPIPPGAGGSTPSVLANDTFNGGTVPPAQVTLSLVGAPAGFSITTTGSIVVPATAPAGALELTYRFCENALPANCASAIARVVVRPDAVNDTVTTPGGGRPVSGSVALNDNHPSGSLFQLVDPPGRGVVTLGADGLFDYAPSDGNTGPDSFSYQLCLPPPDGGACDTATVTVNVADNQLSAADDVFTTPLQPGATAPVSLLANDTLNSAPVSAAAVSLVLSGAPAGYAVNAAGQVLVPAAAVAGAVAFTYQICELPGGSNCATANVQLLIAPDAVDDTFVATAGVPLAGVLSANDNVASGAQYSLLAVATHGTVTVDAAGGFTYTAQPAYTGADSFRYQLCLPAPNSGVCDAATVTLNVGAAVIAAAADDFTTAPLPNTGGTTASVLGNDTFNGQPILPAQAALSLINTPPAGYTLNADGQLQVPAGSQPGPVNLVYQLCQAGTGNCTTATIALVIAPDARDDSFSTQVARALDGNVAANDSVAAGTTYATTGTLPSGLLFNPNGSFSYTPPAQFTGTETFSYQACLAAPYTTVCDTANVSLTVNAGTLVANDDDFRAALLNPATGGTTSSVLANDTINGAVPPAPSDVILSLIGAPAGYVLNSNGTLSVPAGADAGSVAFGYRMCEAVLPGNCDDGAVQLLLAPVAVADTFSTPVATPLSASVAGNDNAPAAASYSVSGSAPAGLVFNGDGSFTYAPPSGSQGAVTFAYRVCLPAPDTAVCAGATATINVNAGTLVANDDDFSSAPLDPAAGGSTASVLGNDTLNGTLAPPSASVLLSLVGAPAGYALQADGVLSVSAGVPAGATTLTYQLCEAALDSNCDAARIRVVVAPAAVADVFSTPAGQLMAGNVASNDNVPTGAVFRVSGSAPAGLLLGPDGTFQYTPPAGFTGPVPFVYEACLPAPDVARCSTATATINVNAGTLLARDDDFSATPLAPGGTTGTSVLGNDSLAGVTPPAAGDVILALVGQPAGYAMDAAGGVQVPADAGAGATVLSYQICERAAPDNCASAAIRLLVTPSAAADAYSIAAGQAVTGNVGDNDNVPPGASFTVTGSVPPGLDFGAGGSFRYVPPVVVVSPVSFDYQVCLPAPDSTLCATATATFTITVGSLVANPDDFSSAPISPLSGGRTLSVLLNDALDASTPPDAADVLLSLVAAPPGYAIDTDGSITVAAGVSAGARVLDYRLCEAAAPGNCSTSTAQLVVAPAAVDDALSTPAGVVLNGSVAGNDNVPADAVFALVGGVPAPAGLQFSATGSFTYTPAAGFSGTEAFSYQACLPAPHQTVCATANTTLDVTSGTLVATDDSFAAPLAAGEVSDSVLLNDSLDNAVPLPAQVLLSLVGAPTGFSVDPDGGIRIAAGTLAGAVTLTYQLCEAAATSNCDTAIVSLVVSPTPVDDAFAVQAGQTVSGNVGSNDNMPLDATYSVQGATPAGLSFTADGSFSYAPPAATSSPTGFVYQACLPGSNAGVCATANVRLNINNGALAANDDAFGPLGVGTSVTSVLANDVLNGVSPPAAGTVALSLAGSPAGITLNANGTLSVGADAAAGAAVLVYQLCEVAAANNCATANITLVVRPTPVDDTITVQAGQTNTGNVAVNDDMPAGSIFSVAVPPQGLVFNDSGSFTYTPPVGTLGPVTFSYQACLPAPDAGVCATAVATLDFSITAIAANDDSFAAPLPAGSITPSVLGNDLLGTATPPPASAVQLLLVGAPAGFVVNSDGSVQIPASATAGATTFTYQLCEAASPTNCDTAAIALIITPTPQADAFAVQAGATLSGASVAGNDNLPVGSRWSVQGTPPTGLTLASDGSFTYAPPAGTVGAVSFTYLACLPAPSAAVCGTASAIINVNTGTLQAGDDSYRGIAPGATTPSVLANDALNAATPPPAGSVLLSLVGAPAGYVINADGSIVVPVGVQSGAASLTYQVCEAAAPANCDTAAVALVINPAPQDDAYALQIDSSISNGTVAANDNLPAGASYTVQGAPPAGLTFNPDGSFVYVPPQGTVGPVLFDYQACLPAPDAALCGTATVTLNINDGTLAAVDDSFIGLAAGTSGGSSVLGNDDLNGSVPTAAQVSVDLVGAPAGFSLDANGLLSVGSGVAAGPVTLTYQLCERAAANNCDTASISVVVSPAPQDDAFSVRAGQSLNGSVAGNDALPPGSLYSLQGSAPAGMQFNADGSFRYVAPGGLTGVVNFIYSACLPAPNSTLCGTASARVTVANGSLSAGDDALAGIAPGGRSATSVLANDSLNGVSPPAAGDVVLSLVGAPAAFTLNPDGTLSAATGAMSGPGTLVYQICEAAAPANCATATLSVVISPAPLDDAVAVQAGQSTAGSVADNDNMPAGSVWSLAGAPPAGLSFAGDGSFNYAPPGGTAGPVQVPYRVCLPAPNGNLCGTASLSLNINNGALAAADDVLPGVLAGTTSSGSVLDNDRLNGATPPAAASVTLALVGAPAAYAITGDGRVGVPASAMAGPLTLTYQLCEAAAANNCDTAQVTVVVAPAPQPDAFAVQVAQTLSASVAGNDSVPPGAQFSVVGVAPAGVVLAANGALTYTPPPGTLGAVGFTYQVCLPAPYSAVCGTAAATINVNNGTLLAADDVFTGMQPGATFAASVLANDSLNGVTPPDASAVRLTLVGAPAGFLIGSDGRITAGIGVMSGITALTYQICEAAAPANCDTANVRVVVSPAPRDDAFAVQAGQMLANRVDGNDNMPPGAAYTLQGTAPAGLVFNVDGSFSYAPPPGSIGPLAVTYQGCLPAPDASLCGTATLTFSINNGTLLAGSDVLGTVPAGAASGASVLANDQLNGVSPPAAATVRLSLVGAPAGVAITPEGQITLGAGVASGALTLTYQICEAAAPSNCDTASATLLVSPSPQADAFAVQSGQSISGSVAGNDGMPAGALWSVQGTPPAGLQFNGNGSFTYAPPAGTLGAVSFTYQACLPAPDAATCGVAVVTLNVNTGTLLAADDSFSGIVAGGATPSVLGNDSLNRVTPPPPASVTLTLVGAPTGFSIAADGSIRVGSGVVSGPSTVTYQVCEAAASSNCAAANVNLVVSPSPQADAFSVRAGATVNNTVAGNDNLPAGSRFSVQGATPPGLTFNSDGSFSYAPSSGTLGAVEFTYQVCLPAPNAALCAVAPVTLNVNTGTLLAANDSFTGIAAGGTTASVLANDSLNAVSPVPPAAVTLSLVGASAGFSISADGSVSIGSNVVAGLTLLTYQVCEAAAASNCATATASVVVSPAPQPDAFNVRIGQALANTVAGNDNLPAGSGYSVQGTAPAGLQFNSDGSFVYSAPAGVTGTVSFLYKACLPAPHAAQCATATVTFNINNGALVAVDDSFSGLAAGSTTPSVLANDLFNGAAPAPGAVTVALLGTPEGFTLNADGTLLIAPDVTSGATTLTYELCEVAVPGNCASATISVLVNPAPQPDAFTVPVGRTLSNTVAGNDNMPAGSVWRVQGALPPGLVFNADGSFTFTPPPGTSGTLGFTYQVCLPAPDAALCSSASVSLVVNGSANVVLAANDDFSGTPVDPAVGGTITASVLDNDSFNTVSPPPVGSVVATLTGSTPGYTLNNQGQIMVAPGVQAGRVPLSYQLCETAVPGNCSTAIATVLVRGAVGALLAVDDDLGRVGSEGRPRALNALANDTFNGAVLDPAQVSFSAVATNALSFSADGWVDVAAGLAPGTYSTTYTLCLLTQPTVCDVGTVSVVVAAWINEMEAEDDWVKVAQNGAIEINVLVNDRTSGTPIDPSTVAVSITAPPPYGTATVMPQARIRFAPTPNFAGTQGFGYQVCAVDNAAECAAATVTVTVEDNVLMLADDAVTAEAGVAMAIDVLANDRARSAPLDPATLQVALAPANGDVQCGNGRCSYTPAPAFAGTDSFRYRVCDMSIPTAQCAEANVAVTVEGQQAVLRLSKVAAKRSAQVGELVRYTVTIDNVGEVDANGATLLDTLPPGFTFVSAGFAVQDADNAARTSGVQPLRIDGIDVAAGERATVVYYLRVGAGTGSGVHTNRITAIDGQNRSIGNVASADVDVRVDPLLDESLIVGSVFDDRNGNGVQDRGERGIPGVRVAAVEGLLMETDAYGRYHLVGIAGGQARGRNFILKVDPSTLPTGSQFITANPLVRRITPGLPVRFDFAVRLPEGSFSSTEASPAPALRPARVELGSALFASGTAQLAADRDAVLDRTARALQERGGGRVVLHVEAAQPPLAVQRAHALQRALAARVPPAVATASWIEVRGEGEVALHRLRLDDTTGPPDGAADNNGEGR